MCRTPAQAEGRKAGPARCWSSYCSRCPHSFCSDADTEQRLNAQLFAMNVADGGETEAYLPARNGELFVTLFALGGLVVFQPGVTLTAANTR